MTVELQAVKGKKAEQEKHLLCRIALLDRIAHDSRFFTMADRILRVVGLDKLHAAAKAELAAGGSADGEAVARYMAAWENDKIVKWTLAHYVSDDLRLPWAWLAPDLYRLLYFTMRNTLPRVKKVQIEYELWAATAGAGRYQNPDTAKNKAYALHVEWFYRHCVKQPPDKMAEIARDMNKEASTVRDGIETARRLLGEIPHF